MFYKIMASIVMAIPLISSASVGGLNTDGDTFPIESSNLIYLTNTPIGNAYLYKGSSDIKISKLDEHTYRAIILTKLNNLGTNGYCVAQVKDGDFKCEVPKIEPKYRSTTIFVDNLNKTYCSFNGYLDSSMNIINMSRSDCEIGNHWGWQDVLPYSDSVVSGSKSWGWMGFSYMNQNRFNLITEAIIKNYKEQ